MSESNENDDFAASCSYCGRKFSYQKNLYIHMRRFHKDKPINYKQKHHIICSLCDETLPFIKVYWDHIRSKHPEVKLSFEKKFFYSEEDFNQWRTETDARTHTHFISTSMHSLRDGRIVQHLQCDRSGIYIPSASVSRKHTSKKIGKYCPAYIYRAKTVVDDLMEIEVDFQSTHAGHKCDLHSLRVRSEKHERRLRNKGKGRWPKKLENSPSSDGIHNEDDLVEKSKSLITGKGKWPKNIGNPSSSEVVQNEHKVALDGKSKSFIKGKGKSPKNIENSPSSGSVQNEHNVGLDGKSKSFIKGKGKRPKNIENPPSSKGLQNEHNVYLDGQSISFIKEISDILEHDPIAEIEHITCTCEEYAKVATCEHIQTLLKSLNSRKPVSQEKNSDDESSGDVDFSWIDADLTPPVAEYCENPGENSSMKSLEDGKAAILEEFKEVVNMCQKSEHLEILKEFVVESRKHLYFTLKNA